MGKSIRKQRSLSLCLTFIMYYRELFVVTKDIFTCFRISVENAYMEEKEDTASALGEIAVNAG